MIGDWWVGAEKGQNELNETLTISFFVVFGMMGCCVIAVAFSDIKRSRLGRVVVLVACPACNLAL